jgi:hypothetical protein
VGQRARGGGRGQGIISTARWSSDSIVDATNMPMTVPYESAESSDHIRTVAGLDSQGLAPTTSCKCI